MFQNPDQPPALSELTPFVTAEDEMRLRLLDTAFGAAGLVLLDGRTTHESVSGRLRLWATAVALSGIHGAEPTLISGTIVGETDGASELVGTVAEWLHANQPPLAVPLAAGRLALEGVTRSRPEGSAIVRRSEATAVHDTHPADFASLDLALSDEELQDIRTAVAHLQEHSASQAQRKHVSLNRLPAYYRNNDKIANLSGNHHEAVIILTFDKIKRDWPSIVLPHAGHDPASVYLSFLGYMYLENSGRTRDFFLGRQMGHPVQMNKYAKRISETIPWKPEDAVAIFNQATQLTQRSEPEATGVASPTTAHSRPRHPRMLNREPSLRDEAVINQLEAIAERAWQSAMHESMVPLNYRAHDNARSFLSAVYPELSANQLAAMTQGDALLSIRNLLHVYSTRRLESGVEPFSRAIESASQAVQRSIWHAAGLSQQTILYRETGVLRANGFAPFWKQRGRLMDVIKQMPESTKKECIRIGDYPPMPVNELPTVLGANDWQYVQSLVHEATGRRSNKPVKVSVLNTIFGLEGDETVTPDEVPQALLAVVHARSLLAHSDAGAKYTARIVQSSAEFIAYVQSWPHREVRQIQSSLGSVNQNGKRFASAMDGYPLDERRAMFQIIRNQAMTNRHNQLGKVMGVVEALRQKRSHETEVLGVRDLQALLSRKQVQRERLLGQLDQEGVVVAAARQALREHRQRLHDQRMHTSLQQVHSVTEALAYRRLEAEISAEDTLLKTAERIGHEIRQARLTQVAVRLRAVHTLLITRLSAGIDELGYQKLGNEIENEALFMAKIREANERARIDAALDNPQLIAYLHGERPATARDIPMLEVAYTQIEALLAANRDSNVAVPQAAVASLTALIGNIAAGRQPISRRALEFSQYRYRRHDLRKDIDAALAFFTEVKARRAASS